ncbi:MAG: OmpL47-type beta-barrel domain-containing protein [Candidatus Nanohaloarchaea archaeon]
MNVKQTPLLATAFVLTAVMVFAGAAAAQPTQGGDCDDTDASIFPGAVDDVCGLDLDCDGNTDDGCTSSNDDPTIDSVSPADGSTVSTTSPQLSVQASDPNGDAITIEIYTGSIRQARKTCTGSCSVSAEWRGLTDGESYTWTVSVDDRRGGTAQQSPSFTVSAGSPPSADAGGPYSVDEGGTVTLDAGSSSDPDGDALSYSWDVSSGSVSGSGSRQTYHAPSSISSDTDVTATLTVDDGSSTDSDTATVSVNNLQDQCGPDTSNSCPGDSACSYSGMCDGSGSYTTYTCQNPDAPDSECVSQTVTGGKCSRSVDPQCGNSCTVGTGVCERTGTVQRDGSCSASPASPSETPETSCDGLDNDCDGQVDEGGVCDADAPSTGIDAPSGWQNTDVTVEFNPSDQGGAGIARTEFCTGSSCNPAQGQTGNSLTIDSEGIHTIRYRSVDTRGNSESVKTATVKVDLSAPGVTVNATNTATGEEYTGGISNEPIQLGVGCNDGTSGCQGQSQQGLQFVGGPGVCPGEGDRFATDTFDNYDVNVGNVLGDEEGEDGTYWVCAAAKDQAANTGFGGSSPDAEQVQVDTTGPSVTASTTSPTNDRRQSVDYEVTEDNLDSCSASGGGIGGNWDCSQSDDNNDGVYQGTCDPQQDMSDGDHDVTVTCEDTAGNTGSDTVDMVVDTTAPSVSCDNCAEPNPVQSGTEVTFDPDVSDSGSGVAQVTICQDEQCTDTYCSTSSGTSCSYTTPDNTFKTEDFWIQATDDAGNTVTVGAGGGETDPSTDTVEQAGETFTMKKAIGDPCTSNVACYIGSCMQDSVTGQRTCDATVIPEPGIILR